MAYEDTNCPCGGLKERETMLCPACVEFTADHPARRSLVDPLSNWEGRRQSAIILITVCRRRRQQLYVPRPITTVPTTTQ